MKRVLIVCSILTVLCCLFAGSAVTSQATPASPVITTLPTQQAAPEAKENSILQEKAAARAAYLAIGKGRDGGGLDNCTTAFPEDFESVTVPSLPACWTQTDVNTDGVYWKTGSTGHTLPKCAWCPWAYPQMNDWLFGAGVTLTGGTAYQLKFWVLTSSSYNETWSIWYGGTQSAVGMTNNILPTTTFMQATWAQRIYSFTPVATGTYYIGWYVTSADAYYIYMDDIELVVAPQAPGRCCYGTNPCQPVCDMRTQADCQTLGGTWDQNLTCATACPTPQAGELCCNALPLTVPGTVAGSTCGFQNNYDAVCPYSGSSAPDVVYTYTPTANQQVTFSLCQGTTNYDTKLYVFAGSCTGTPLACNDDMCTSPLYGSPYVSRVDCVPLTAGTTYYIVVDGYGASCGNYTLTAAECVQYPPPANDNCANAQPIVVNGDQICATTQGATQDCAQLGIPEIWYSFTTTQCMNLLVSYCGTTTSGSLNAVLFGGSCCGTLVGYSSYEWTTCPDGLISLHFDNLAAGTYWLPVGFTPAGPFCVRVTGTPCPVPCTPDQQVTLNPSYPHFPNPQTSHVCAHLVVGTVTQVVVPVHNFSNVPTVSITPGCPDCDDPNCQPLSNWVLGPWVYVPNPPEFVASLTAADGSTGCCVCLHMDYVLPVELQAFDGLPGDNSVNLTWTTASETNAHHFEIVREGTVMARVVAVNSATGSSYHWTDASVQNGTTYHYSLVAVGIAGNRQELGTVAVTPSFSAAEVTEYALHQNYPNPFNPTTSIALDLMENGFVTLKVYNLMGQEVASLVNGNLEKGRHVVSFDASSLSSGVYLYRLTVNGFVAEKKMLLMK